MSTNNAAHTPGPVIDPAESCHPYSVWNDDGNTQIAACRWLDDHGKPHAECVQNNEEAKANASLIAETFNVKHETGLTPRQLAEQRAELLGALQRLSGAVAATRAGKRDGYTFGALSSADDVAKAVIAKATGGAK